MSRPAAMMAELLRRRRGMMPLDAPGVVVAPPEMDPPQLPLEAPRVIEVPLSPEDQLAAAEARAAVAAMPPPEMDDSEEMWAAQEADRKSGLSAGLELASRQLTAGLTQRPVSQSIGRPPSREHAVMEAGKSRRQQAADVLNRRRQATLDESLLAQRGHAMGVEGRKATAAAEGLASYKQTLTARYPGQRELIAGLTTMEEAKDFQNSFDAELGRGTTIEAARIAAAATRGEARDVRTEKEVAELAKISGADAAMGFKSLDIVDAAVAANPGAVPGVGALKSRLTPDWLLSDKGAEVRAEANNALAIMLKVRSGATVSVEELARSKMVYGLTGNQEQFAAGVKRLRRDFNEALRASQAGYGPGVKKTFEERGGTLPTPTTKPSPGPGFERGTYDGRPGWINQVTGMFEAY